MAEHPESAAIRCSQCGASLEVATPAVASVLCLKCGHTDRLDAELLAELNAHDREIRTHRDRQRSAEEQAIISELTRTNGAKWGMILVGSWLLAGAVIVPGTWWAYLLALVIMIAPFFVLARAAKKLEAEARVEVAKRRAQEERVQVDCITCGGCNELTPDSALAPCAFCGGALVAEQSRRWYMAQVAEQSAQRERHRARHEAWATAAKNHRDPSTELIPYFVVGGIGSLFVIGSVVASFRFVLMDVGESGDILALNLIALAVVLGVGTPYWFRRRRKKAWSEALQAFTDHFSGELSRSPDAFAHWLQSHWRDEFSTRRISAGSDYAFVARHESPGWGLSAAPNAEKDGIVEIHLRILVPGAPGTWQQDNMKSLRGAGYQVEMLEEGLVATAPPATLEDPHEALANARDVLRLISRVP